MDIIDVIYEFKLTEDAYKYIESLYKNRYLGDEDNCGRLIRQILADFQLIEYEKCGDIKDGLSCYSPTITEESKDKILTIKPLVENFTSGTTFDLYCKINQALNN